MVGRCSSPRSQIPWGSSSCRRCTGPAALSYSVPTIAYLVLSYVFFKPTVAKLLLTWVAGFALYLVIHLLIATLFDWTFMFPFWVPRLLA